MSMHTHAQLSNSPERKRLSFHRVCWLCLLVVPMSLAAGCGEPNASVTIDNAGNNSPMSVAIDGQPAGSIPADSFKTFSMQPSR